MPIIRKLTAIVGLSFFFVAGYLCSFDPGPVGAKKNADVNIYLNAGERFTVVCLSGNMEYGFNGVDAIAGWCPQKASK